MLLNLHNAELSHVAGHASQHLRAGTPQIAFSGRSNVGKSSMINSLLMRKKLARVSSDPGKTITVNYYLIDKKLYLVDLPGYGFAHRAKEDKARWSAVTQSYFEDNTALKLVAQLIDCKVGVTADDADMLEWLNYTGTPYMVIYTKCDKLNKTELAACADRIITSPHIKPGTDIVLYSSKTGAGREAVIGKMLSVAGENG